MSRRPFVVFDLDGTLIDGYAAIGDALGYAMERLGAPPPSPAEVRRMVGHGLERLLEKAVGVERAAEGVRLFRERYPAVAVPKSHLVPGARETVEALDRSGHPLAVASNKPAAFSRMILEAKGVVDRFRAVGGPDAETPAKPDPTMLVRLMDRVGAAPEETLVVGDMEVDFEFARAAGCRVVLIPGGSRTREELEGVTPDAFLGAIAELPAWLTGAADRK
ncbi:MAG TPA: HAD-IA family hydrolase [Thermoanaerobaculia bacterium]|nr:HAD-IA family hydrolase [Thermoanaerobaculia bacterium]